MGGRTNNVADYVNNFSTADREYGAESLKKAIELTRKSGYKKIYSLYGYGAKAGDPLKEIDIERREGETDEQLAARVEQSFEQQAIYFEQGGFEVGYTRPDPGTLGTGGVPGPPTPPDLTDSALNDARLSMALRLQATRGRSSTFTNGNLGRFDVSKPALGGY